MKDLCFDICGIEKEKKDPKDVKGNRGWCLLLILCFNFAVEQNFLDFFSP